MGNVPVAHPTPPRRLRLRRATLIAGSALLTVLAAMVVLVAFARPEASRPAIIAAGRVDQFELDTVEYFEDDHFFLVRLRDGSFLALTDAAQHLENETVEWRPDFEFQGTRGWYRSRMHGETFSRNGGLVFGPAARDMDRYAVTIERGIVRVDTSMVICGNGWERDVARLPCTPPSEAAGAP